MSSDSEDTMSLFPKRIMDGEALVTTEANRPRRGGSHNKGARHSTARDLADILRWHKQGLTQQQIAERLGRPNSQGQISTALRMFATDNTAEAKQILRGGAASMALNIVKRGQPKDQVQALKGLGVLEEQQQQGVIVHVGPGSSVKIGVLVSPQPASVEGESLQIQAINSTESDNRDYVD